jgi:trigger factor
MELTVEIPVERVSDEYDRVFREIQKNAKIDGFRKGKVPLNIIEKRYYDNAGGQVAENLVKETVWEAMSEKKVAPISQPVYDFDSIQRDEPFTYRAVFETPPTVELGKYKAIPAEQRTCKITDEDVQDEIDSMREKQAESTPRAQDDARVEMGDLVSLKMARVDDVPEEETDSLEFKDYNIVVGKSREKARIDDELVGMKSGEEKDITVKYPKDYHIEEVAGQKVTYRVKVQTISEMNLPPLDDEFAKKAGYESKDDMFQKTREYMETFVEDRTKNEARNQIVKTIIENSTFDIPETMIENEMESMFKRTQERIGLQHDNMDEFARMLGMEPEDFRGHLREDAERTVKTTLVLREIASQEELSVDEERYREVIQTLAMRNNRSEEEIEKMIEDNDSRKSIEGELLVDRALEYVYEEGKIKKLKPIPLVELLSDR